MIDQLQLAPDSNESTAALALLKSLPSAGCIVTGDASFTQKEICRVITDGGCDYFFTVKGNQPALRADIALAFGGGSPLEQDRHHLTSPAPRRSARTMATSRPEFFRRPAPLRPMWDRLGPAWHKSAASPATGRSGARKASRRATPSPA